MPNMSPDLLERRKEMLRFMVKYQRLGMAVEKLQEKWPRVSYNTFKKDWNKRDKWLPLILKLEDPTLLHEIVAGLKEIIPQAWATAGQAGKNLNAKIGALRLASDTYLRLGQLLQEAGKIEKAPIRVEMEKQFINWDELPEDEKDAILRGARIILKVQRNQQP